MSCYTVATAYCMLWEVASLHTLATYTQVKSPPSINKEIFILWMVLFYCAKNPHHNHIVSGYQINVELNVSYQCTYVYTVQCTYLVCKFLFLNYIKCYLDAHIYFLCQAYKIELTFEQQWILNVSLDSCWARECMDWLKV